MGVRLAMRKELMGLNHSDMLTADDVREHLSKSIKKHDHKPERGFSVISKFNDTHSRVLEFERHRLFKEVLYTRKSVDAWLDNQIN